MNRDELEAQLRTIIHACPQDANTICSYCDQKVTRVLELIDQYTNRQHGELWTAEQVATYLGRDSAHSARAWLSYNGIKSVTTQPTESGRLQALYPADEIRVACYRKAFT